jgi:predicted RNase H-like nuclease
MILDLSRDAESSRTRAIVQEMDRVFNNLNRLLAGIVPTNKPQPTFWAETPFAREVTAFLDFVGKAGHLAATRSDRKFAEVFGVRAALFGLRRALGRRPTVPLVLPHRSKR